jgi:signal transduction histidine kinase
MVDETEVSRLQARLSRRERELEAARRVSEEIKQHASLDDIVRAAVTVAMEVVGGRAGSVMLANREREELVFHVSVGENPVAPGTSMPWKQGIAGQVFHSGQPQVVRQIDKTQHYDRIDALTGFRTENMFALPLKPGSGQPIGVLEVLNKANNGPEEEDLAVLNIIATMTALTIEQARLFEESKLSEVVHRLSDVGHDIKNMLFPVTVGMDIIQTEVRRWFDGPNPPQGAQALAIRAQVTDAVTMVKRSVRRVQDRVRQIADFVKGRQSPPEFEPCAPDEVIGEVIATLRLVAADRRILLRAVGMEHLSVIDADKSRLYTAFYNLVDNAIPEVHAGGEIVIEGKPSSDPQCIVIVVRDNGRGMPPDVRDTLFSAKTRSRKRGGTGLGTKIVQDVVYAHGGRITVESEEDRGTTFTITLPIRRSAAK